MTRRHTRSWTRPAIGVVAVGAAVAIPLLAFGGSTARATDGRLEPFRTCGEFAALARRRALDLLDANPSLGVAMPMARDGVLQAGPARTALGVGQKQLHAEVDRSTTNVQVAGIDEPDIVKGDGSRTFAIASGRVYAIDTSGETPRVAGSVALPDGVAAREMLLVGDRLLVIADGSMQPVPLPTDGAGVVAPDRFSRGGITFVEVDVRDMAAMRVRDTLQVDADYVSARLSGTTARIALNGDPMAHIGAGATDERDLRARIERAGADEFIPRYVLRDRGGATSEGSLVDCGAISHPARGAGVGMLTILTMDLAQGIRPVDADAVMAQGATAMASPRRIYVALSRSDVEDRTVVAKTEIHAFDTTSPNRTTYVASGTVLGNLLNQFAMSEYDGRLRVATTLESFPVTPRRPAPVDPGTGTVEPGSPTAPPVEADDPATVGTTADPDPAVTSPVSPGQGRESAVSVMEERDGRLVQIGRVAGLGRGERIYAVRFIGPTGYVVTFRQIDPLYTVDLSDPLRPRVAGELKIPGYSAYLHAVDERTLIGVGQNAATSPDGRFATTAGLQVGLFDVSDPAAPRRTHVWTLPGAYSNAEFDHRAFLWWPKSRLLVLPLSGILGNDGTGGATWGSGAIALRVTSSGIRPLGLIRHPRRDRTAIRRSLVVDDRLLTLSDAGLGVSTLDGARLRRWVPLG